MTERTNVKFENTFFGVLIFFFFLACSSASPQRNCEFDFLASWLLIQKKCWLIVLFVFETFSIAPCYFWFAGDQSLGRIISPSVSVPVFAFVFFLVFSSAVSCQAVRNHVSQQRSFLPAPLHHKRTRKGDGHSKITLRHSSQTFERIILKSWKSKFLSW